MPFLDTLIYGVRKVFNSGTQVLERNSLDFKNGLQAVDNPTTGRTDVSINYSGAAGISVTVGPAGSGASYEVDGVSDEVQINAAIAAVALLGGGSVVLLRGTYSINAPVSGASNVTLEGQGRPLLQVSATFDYDTHKYVVGCVGSDTTGTAIPVTSNVAVGDQVFTTTAGAELSAVTAGSYVFIRSQGLLEGASENTGKVGEYAKVLSVSGADINIFGNARFNYLTTDTANVYRISFIQDFHVVGFDFTQATAQGTVSTTQASVPPFVSLQRALRCSVKDCRFRNGDSPAVTVFASIDCEVSGCVVQDLTDSTASKYYGYGVLVGGPSEQCSVSNNRFSRLRHGVDSGTSLTASTVVSGYGVAFDTVVTGNTVEHATNACYSTHAGAIGWLFAGNVAANSLCYGFFMRGRRSKIVSNSVHHCGGGIGLGSTSFGGSSGSATDSHVLNNTITNIKAQTITAELLALGVLSSTYAEGEGIVLGLTDGCVVAGNSISGTDGAAIRLRLSAIRNQILRNNVTNANTANTSNAPAILIDANNYGSSASIAHSGTTTTLSGMTGMASQHIGRSIVITNAASGGNNGTFTITEIVSATSVRYENASGVDADANNGTIDYAVEGVTDNLIADNFARNLAASDYDPDSVVGHAKYLIRDAGVALFAQNNRNVFRNNVGIGMDSGLISTNVSSYFASGNSNGEAIPVKTYAGIPTDSLFADTPSNGTLALNTANNQLYARSSDVWDSVAGYKVYLPSNFTTTADTQQDTGLKFAVRSGEKWLFKIDAVVQCDNTGGVKYSLSAPAASTVEGFWEGGSTTVTGNFKQRLTALDTLSNAAHTVANTPAPNHHWGHVTAGADGDVVFNICATTSGQEAKVFAKAVLTAIKVSSL